MHESVRALEIEKKIYELAQAKGLKDIYKVTIKIGQGEPESRRIMEHLINDHMKLKECRFIEEDIALKCGACGNIINEDTLAVRCLSCGSSITSGGF